MKTNLNYLFFAFFSIAIFTTCSKEDNKVETGPDLSIFETNTPPSGNYYSGVYNDDVGGVAAWTTDFKNFNKFTGEFNQVYNVKVENDTVLIAYTDIHLLNYIAYAPTNNLSNFKIISSQEPITEFSILDGIIIVYSKDGLNKYTGYCKLNQGMTSVQFSSILPTDIEYSNFTNTGTAIIANQQNSSTTNMAYTTDGIAWNVPGTISAGRFEVFDGKTWRFGGQSFDYTTDTDLSSATWTNTLLHQDSLNTTDTSGAFSGSYLDVNSTSIWRYYGRIFNGTTAYPALNISTDQGVTWKTQLLTSIQSVDDNSYLDGEYFSISSLAIWMNTNSSYQFPIGVYTAINGVDFTYDGSQASINKFNSFWNANYVR